jgi:serine/threonine protein kinase
MSNRVGQQFGKYRLLQLLGQGGFAEVYLGKHIQLGSSAAIKILNSPVPDVQAFRDEARILASLNHPNIVRVIDYDVEGNIPFLVMGYASQGTLRNRHPLGTPVHTAHVLSYVSQIASALQYAHNHKTFHCDVKPENMLIGENDEVLLSDFGLAVMTASLQYTKPAAGTAIYMAPEQIDGKVQTASDQYALGVVVYEWLCGKPPFSGSYREITAKHLHIAPPGFKEQGAKIPSAVEAVVMRALTKEPVQRFASVQAFAQALQQRYSQQQEKPYSTHSSRGQSVVNPTKPQGTVNQQQLPPPTHQIGGMSQSLPPLNAANPTPIVTPYTPQSLPPAAANPTPIVTPYTPPRLRQDPGPAYPPYTQPTNPPVYPVPGRKRRAGCIISALVTIFLLFALVIIFGPIIHSLISLGTFTPTPPPTPTLPLGRTWTLQNSGTSEVLYDGIWARSQYVVVGSKGTILTSPDGHNWTTQKSNTSNALYGITWSGSQYLVVGCSATVLTSPDGRSWTTQNVGMSTSVCLNSIAWSGSLFVATTFVAAIILIPGPAYTSPDGRTWTPHHPALTQYLLGVTWSGWQFVAVGANGTILTSPNGQTWAAQDSGTTQSLSGVIWSGSQFVTVGYNGTILTSPNGQTWAAQNSGTTQSLSGVIWSGSQFVTVGYNGTILTSPNGQTWTAQNSGTAQPLKEITSSGSQLMTMGDHGTILTSP